MIVVFAGTWESYVVIAQKNSKKMLLKRTITQPNSKLPPGLFIEFLNRIPSSI